ncbi:rhodanese-like domain-containing protein [Asticcacaulis sp. AC402]|uniref:rhodanese-like domain-containing protein n=1 Tax=Asticcacaulis sp. AC402 TaxID=1282361 RepID=UPI0003C3F668|nr:rhodanese-like domain-containing protein [Asticcacaulis sp. AC402]ESQ73709.1 hypothetical protein ABAC402_17745 [Asticcacaulis sp. AC402]
MFSQFTVKNLSPEQVRKGLDADDIILIDVREPDEHNAECIQGAVNLPLSRLAGTSLPESDGKTLVMQCAGGVRSAKAVAVCRKRGLKVDHHLAGGIAAWKAAGLPTTR